MLPYDHDPLRVRLATDFAFLSNGVKDAAEVSEILALLAQTTITALCELAESWSRSNDLLWVFPDELLASCMSFLPFEDRITASHVSRRWRTTALAYPAIWADLSIPLDRFRDQNRIVRMALSRTGSHPVDMRGLSQADPEEIIPQCLREHMHHLRLLEWDLPAGALPSAIRAPLLETLVCYDYHLDIPSRFLGGQPACLRVLNLGSATFPAICPSLSTVSSLAVDGPTNLAGASTFGRLFDLFPVLQSLRLTRLMEVYSASLPHGPAPSSLRNLELKSSDPDYDLSAHYIDWRTDSLLEVSLEQECSSVSHLDRLLDGSRKLWLGRDSFLEMTYVIAEGPGDRAHTIKLGDGAGQHEDTGRTANMLLAVQSSLQRIASVELPITFLVALLPVLAVLPKLRRLTVCIEPEIDTVDEIESHHFSWAGFNDLQRLKEHCPTIQELILDVFCAGEGDCPLSSDDARQLLERIASLGECVMPDIRVMGFPQDLVSGLEVPGLDGVSIVFGTESADVVM